MWGGGVVSVSWTSRTGDGDDVSSFHSHQGQCVKVTASTVPSPSSILLLDKVSYRVLMNFYWFSGAFAKPRKATVSCVMFVRPSVRMEQLGYLGTDFHEIWCFGIFRKSVEKFRISLKSNKIKEYFTWSHIKIFDRIYPNSS